MEKSPSVSVIIPVYNTEKYLLECLESVIHQSFTDIEIICINDCSPDNSERIIRDLMHQDKRIILISNELNKGLGYSRNRGIAIAKGKYILYLDSDDILEDEVLGELFERSENDNLDILCGNFTSFYDKECLEIDRRSRKDESYRYDYPGVRTGLAFFTDTQSNNEFRHHCWGNLYKYEWLKKNRILFPENVVYEDIFWSYQCFYLADRVGFFQKPAVRYRIRNRSIMGNLQSFNSLKSFSLAAEKMLFFSLEHHISEENHPDYYRWNLYGLDRALRLYKENPDFYRTQAKTEDDRKMLINLDLCLLEREKYLDEIDSIYRSNSWQFGNLLMRPLHRLKNLLQKR